MSCQRMIQIQDYLAMPQEPRPGQEIPTRMVACGCLVTQRWRVNGMVTMELCDPCKAITAAQLGATSVWILEVAA